MQESRTAVASLKDTEQRPAVLRDAMQDIEQVTRTGSAAQPRDVVAEVGELEDA